MTLQAMARASTMNKIRVLIADGNAVAADGLQSILCRHEEVEVVGWARTGVEAVAKAAELSPSVILMDAQIPVIDGMEAIRRIKRRSPETKIICLSVYPDYTGVAASAGADLTLLKDCGREELCTALRRLAGWAPRGG